MQRWDDRLTIKVTPFWEKYCCGGLTLIWELSLSPKGNAEASVLSGKAISISADTSAVLGISQISTSVI